MVATMIQNEASISVPDSQLAIIGGREWRICCDRLITLKNLGLSPVTSFRGRRENIIACMFVHRHCRGDRCRFCNLHDRVTRQPQVRSPAICRWFKRSFRFPVEQARKTVQCSQYPRSKLVLQLIWNIVIVSSILDPSSQISLVLC